MNDNTMAERSLRELFEVEYGWAKMPLLPYGTPLTLEDFECWPPSPGLPMGWKIRALDDRGDSVEYRISPLPDEPKKAIATVDGKPAKCREIATLEELSVAPIIKWCDWILLTDAHARISAGRDVQVEDWLYDEIHRLDSGVSQYCVHEDNIGTFASVTSLEKWANWALATSVVRVEILQVWPRGATPGETSEPLRALRVSRRMWGSYVSIDDWTPDNSEVAKPSAFIFDPNMDLWSWREGMANAGMRVGMSIDHSGSEMLGYRVANAVSWQALQANCRLSRGHNRRSTWWAIHVLGTDLATVMPSTDVNLVIGVQDDGAMVYIQPWMTDKRAPVNQGRDKMEREWGRWLDMTVELSDAELAEGINKAEAMARGRQKH